MSSDRRSERLENLPDLDYKKLHATGRKILKPPTLQLPQSEVYEDSSSSNLGQDTSVFTEEDTFETEHVDSVHLTKCY